MTDKEYNQLLKFVYFNEYADSYAEAETLLEEISDEDFENIYDEFEATKNINLVCEYLVSEGFARDKESATAILGVISDKWLEQIMEVKITPMTKRQMERAKLYTHPNRHISAPNKAALKRMMASRAAEDKKENEKPEKVVLGNKEAKPTSKRVTDLNTVKIG